MKYLKVESDSVFDCIPYSDSVVDFIPLDNAEFKFYKKGNNYTVHAMFGKRCVGLAENIFIISLHNLMQEIANIQDGEIKDAGELFAKYSGSPDKIRIKCMQEES